MPLVVFEGIDGSGKTHQASKLLKKRTAVEPESAVLTSSPTKGPFGKFVREVFEGRIVPELPSWRQMVYLFQTDLEEHAVQLKKWLQAGRLVICDRYWMSCMTYQVVSAMEDGEDFLKASNWIASLNEHMPDPALTIIFDLPVEESLKRRGKDPDLFERSEYLQKVRELYQQIEGERIERVDTFNQSEEETAARIGVLLETYGLV